MASLNQLIEQHSVRLVALQMVRELTSLLQVQKPSKGAGCDIEMSEVPPRSGFYQVVIRIGKPGTAREQQYLVELAVDADLSVVEPLSVTLASYGEHQLDLKFRPTSSQRRPLHATNMAVMPQYLGPQEVQNFEALTFEERRVLTRQHLTDLGLGPWY